MNKVFNKMFALPLIFLLSLSMLFIVGCNKNHEEKDMIYDNMSGNVSEMNVTVGDNISRNVSINVNSTVNSSLSVINDNSTLSNLTLNEGQSSHNSVYSQYRDTGLIDESIDDLESLN